MDAVFVITCPCCGGKLTIDPELRAVIAHEAPPAPRSGLDLGGALSALRGAAARREQDFKAGLDAEQRKTELLERKFKESLKKAKDDPGPPVRPMDLD